MKCRKCGKELKATRGYIDITRKDDIDGEDILFRVIGRVYHCKDCEYMQLSKREANRIKNIIDEEYAYALKDKHKEVLVNEK